MSLSDSSSAVSKKILFYLKNLKKKKNKTKLKACQINSTLLQKDIPQAKLKSTLSDPDRQFIVLHFAFHSSFLSNSTAQSVLFSPAEKGFQYEAVTIQAFGF